VINLFLVNDKICNKKKNAFLEQTLKYLCMHFL